MLSQFMVTILVSVVTGVASSLVASWLFLQLFVKKLRPKFEISPYIAEEPNGDSFLYRFKAINKSGYRCHDIRMRLYMIQPSIGAGLTQTDRSVGPVSVYNHEIIPLSMEEFSSLDRYDKKDAKAMYALRIRCFENLRDIWRPGVSYLRLEISGCHAVSGLRETYSREFVNPQQCIKPGVFHNGSDLNVY